MAATPLRKTFETPKAPITSSPYLQAIIFKDLIFVSGQGPLDPKTLKAVGDTTEEQTRVTLNNIKTVLEEAGTSMENVLKVTVYLKRMEDFGKMNSVYREFFPVDPPARSTVGVDLPDILVEIDAIAAIP